MKFKELLVILRYKHLIVLFSYALGAFAITMAEFSLSKSIKVLTGGLCIFASTYGYNYVTDLTEDILNNKPNPLRSIDKNIYLSLLFILSIVGLFFSFFTGPTTLILAIAILLLGYSYSHEYVRFKKYGWIKTLALTVSWFLIFIYFSSAFPRVSISKILFGGIFFAILSFCGMLLQDIPDIEGDIQAKIKTIPIMLGIQGTGKLMLLATFLQYFLLFYLLVGNLISFTYILLLLVLPLRVYLINVVIKGRVNKAYFPSIISYPLTGATLFISETIRITGIL